MVFVFKHLTINAKKALTFPIPPIRTKPFRSLVTQPATLLITLLITLPMTLVMTLLTTKAAVTKQTMLLP
jgi:hypothetical protein